MLEALNHRGPISFIFNQFRPRTRPSFSHFSYRLHHAGKIHPLPYLVHQVDVSSLPAPDLAHHVIALTRIFVTGVPRLDDFLDVVRLGYGHRFPFFAIPISEADGRQVRAS